MNFRDIIRYRIYTKISRQIVVSIFVLHFYVLPAFGQQIRISTGAYLNIMGTSYIRIDNGDLINNGAYARGTETVTLSGTTAKTISGSSNTALYNLVMTNTGGVVTKLGLLTSNDLTIEANSKFTIDASKTVTVAGILTNNAGTGGLLVISDGTGTASLIHNSNNVPAIVQRYVSGASEDWHFLSSPVSAQMIGGSWLPSGTYGNGTGYDLYLWNEPNNCWIYKLNSTSIINWNTVHPGQNFVAGRGYLYSLKETNPTKEFAGNLNNGAVSYALTSISSDPTLTGFNLVGNPYPSSIDWSVATGWTRSNLVASGGGYDMWIWNPSAGNYGTCNSNSGSGTNGVTSYIAPMQGYFVRAASAGNLVTGNAVRLHTGAGDWKKGELNPDRLDLVVQSSTDSSYDEVRLQFGFTIDQNGTAKLFSPVVSAPSLYFSSDRANFTVQYLTSKIDHPLIPVMFVPGRDGNYTLQCNFDPTNFETVILEDRQAKNQQNMKASPLYAFSAFKTDAANRFYLHFNSQNNLSENKLPATIYSEGSQLIVDLIAVPLETEIIVYDVIGRKLFQQNLAGGIRHTLNFNAGNNISLVSLQNADGTLCRKIVSMR